MNTTTSKPTSLLALFPEKEPIIFDVNLCGAPPEIENLLQHTKVIAEQFLYRWKTFPITIPKPLSTIAAAKTIQQQDSRKSRPSLVDLFHNPPFDELDSVALDIRGEPKRLSKNQLKELREKGVFSVPSLNFPGQEHRWKLSEFLQKGYLRTRESLLNDLALAAQLIIITARNRAMGDFFSISTSTRALVNGVILLIDMIVGVPSLIANDLDHKIREERSRFLVAELSICGPEYEDCMDAVSNFVRKQLRRATTEKFDVECEMMEFSIPYVFRTPKGLEIDLRLFSKDIMRKALPILINILEREKCSRVRERIISELCDNKLIATNIEEDVNEAIMHEYLQRVYSCVQENPDLAKLGEKIPQLLVEQAKSFVCIVEAVEKVQKDIDRKKSEQQMHLMNAYPILSKVRPWLEQNIHKFEMSTMSERMWTASEEAIKMTKKHNLQQTAYFLCRDLTFLREREPILLKELRKVKTPTRSFQWPCRIWSPKSWIVRRIFQGNSEIIQTVICQQATSIVMPRSDPSQPVFLVEKETIRTNTTRWPFWRILNFMLRIWCYLWNVMYLFGYIIPWDSPLGMRALFSVKPFMPQLELSQVNGTLFPRKTSITQTLASRLIELWRHISKKRTQFESEPDTGFISKGVVRAINQIWNYFFKGFIGTVSILFFFPILCIVVSFGSIIFAITAPLWIPFSVLLLHLFMIFAYDLDCPNESRNRYCIILEAIVWNIFMQGILQPILAIFVGGILCPIAALAIFIFSIIRMTVRQIWDYVIFNFFIKKYARVPSNDSFAVKRILGPGLAMDYSLSIKPEQALAAFEARMELDELEAFETFTEQHILQPQHDFKQFVDACFGPFSSQLNIKSNPYKSLERESRELLSLLKEKLEKRRRELQIGLTVNVRNRIRLHVTDLKISIQHGAHLLQRFYPKHVIDRLPTAAQESFWISKDLHTGDWTGLAQLLFTQIFSRDFLTPICNSDTIFKLEPNMNLDLVRYIGMVQSASDITGINGPDLLENVFSPNLHQANLPYLDADAFNPRSKVFLSFKKNDKGINYNSVASINQTKCKSNGKFVVPMTRLNLLPIPHPVYTAIGIFNRDSDDPIPLDDNICLNILKALEECNDDAINVKSYYRDDGERSSTTTRDPSIESLEDGEENEDKFSTHESLTSTYNTRESVAIAGTNNCETLPCGAVTSHEQSNDMNKKMATKSFKWTLKNNSNIIRVDLASPEDISLDTDNSSRVGFGTYGTTV